MIKRWADILSGTGAVIFSALSCALCPLCLPVYAGFLSLIGIEVAHLHTFLLPVTAGFSFLSLGFMGYQTYTHKGSWGAFSVAFTSVAFMLIAAFYDCDFLLYGALAIFMGTLFWNKRKLTHKGSRCC